MPFLGNVGSGSASGTNLTSVTITINTTIAVGTTLIGSIVTDNASPGNAPGLALADSHSNSYVVDMKQPDTSFTVAVAVFSCRVTTQINASDTITLTISGTSPTHSRCAVSVQAFNDILAGTRVDQTAGASGSSTTPNAGTTATTTSANELVYAAFGFSHSSSQTLTAGSGFTAGAQVSIDPGTANRSTTPEWKYVTAIGTQNPTATLAPTASWAGATVTYKASTTNVPPTANAGPDQNVTVSSTVTLDGSGSSDPDGTIASYAWTQISGTAVTLSSTTVQKPTFTAPGSPATLVFGLIVTDNLGASSTQDTVTINVGNKVGYVGEALADFSTTSSNNFTTTFTKAVSSGHTLLIGLIVDAPVGSDSSPLFTAITDTKGNTYSVDSVGYRAATVCSVIISGRVTTPLTTSDTITFPCTTARGRWAVSAAEFDNIHTTPLDVVANNNAATTTNLVSGTTPVTQNQVEVVFASFGFAHSTSQTLTAGTHYTQAGTQQNTGNAAGHRAVANEYRIFTAATTHQATATLSSTSGYSAAIATYAADLIADQAPIANAGPPQTVAAFDTVTLDGTGSTDEDGFVTGYSWQQTAGPTVTLSSATASQPTFTAPGVDNGTTLTFSLVVTDNLGTNSSNNATVTITVNTAESFVAHSGAWVGMPEYAAHAGSWS